MSLPDQQFCHRRLIGETHTATIAAGRLVAMQIARDGDGAVAGSRVQARLATRLGRRGIARTAGGEDLLVEPWPNSRCEGETIWLSITRAAWPEPGRDRLAKARPLSDRPLSGGKGAAAAGKTARAAPAGQLTDWPEWLDTAWEEAFDAAELGLLPFAGGRLLFTPTPALLAVDVDGSADGLALPALVALAKAIRLWGLGGAIVIDLPDTGRADRQLATAAFDRQMSGQPFERSAINGFGLLQVVLARTGPSILERARLDPTGTAAVQILNSAARSPGHGPLHLPVSPSVSRWLASRPHLLLELGRATGRPATAAAAPPKGGNIDPPAN